MQWAHNYILLGGPQVISKQITVLLDSPILLMEYDSLSNIVNI